jgi:hypothetical protein
MLASITAVITILATSNQRVLVFPYPLKGSLASVIHTANLGISLSSRLQLTQTVLELLQDRIIFGSLLS